MLQINLVVEDAKISLEELQEEIQEIEDYVQSTDVAGEWAYSVYLNKLTRRSYAKALIVHYRVERSARYVMNVIPSCQDQVIEIFDPYPGEYLGILKVE